MKRWLGCLLAVNLATAATPDTSGLQAAPAPDAPAFLYNTLGQPWQPTGAGRLHWESTLGLGAAWSFPGSIAARSGNLLLSARTGLLDWADAGLLLGGAAASVEEVTSRAALAGITLHASADLAGDRGLALYFAPTWTWDDGGSLAASSVTITGVYGNEPDAGWSRDFNLALAFSDHGALGATQSPELDNVWSFSALAAAGNNAPDGLSGFSGEAFAAYTGGSDPAQSPEDQATAWRLGGGVGWQENWGSNPKGLQAWAAYAGFQWERAEFAGGVYTTPSVVANFSVGACRAFR
jgi:hypothetical protein